MVVNFVFVLLVVNVAVLLYSQAAMNGNYTSAPDFPMASQVANYTATSNAMSSSLANATSESAASPNPANTFGLGAIGQAAAQAITLTFSSLGMMLAMVSSTQAALAFIIPPWIFTFGMIFITLIMVFAILAAVFKWWI